MKFKFLTGDINWQTYGAKWISPKLNNGDFDYWLVLEFINMDEACGRDNEGQSKYNVSVSAVSPSQVSPEEMQNAIDSCGVDSSEQDNPILQVSCLSDYGICAPLWQSNDNNASKLMREAKKEAEFLANFTKSKSNIVIRNSPFSCAMDRAVNRIGTTGWEAIKGDITAGLSRTIASGTTEGNILAKMHGLN